MAKRNYISEDFADKLERARRKTQRLPQPHRQVPSPVAPPIVSSLFRVYNNASQTIPEFAPMQVEAFGEYTGFTGTHDAYSVGQATSTGTQYLVNSGSEIPAGYFGAGTLTNEPEKVLFDTGASPSLGDRCAPSPGTWYMTTDSQGEYIALGDSGDDDDTVIVIRRQTKPDSLIIGVTLGSTAAITATVTSRPPSWDTVPGETAGIVSITNPSSIALSTDSLSLHAAYCERNSSSQWELLGSGGGGGSETIAYGSMLINGTTYYATGSTYTKFSIRVKPVTEYGLTASTANNDFTIITEGDYYISWHVDSVSLANLSATDCLVDIAPFRNSSGIGNNGAHVQLTVENIAEEGEAQMEHETPAAANTMAHLRSSDVIDLRWRTNGSEIAFDGAQLSLQLMRATTST